MERTRAYRRYQQRRAIRRKQETSRYAYGMDWFRGVDGKYSKGHVRCGCGLCKPGKRFRVPAWADARKTAVCRREILEVLK